MKLNAFQKLAMAMFLGEKVMALWSNYSIIGEFDLFCDGKITEWRIISNFGLSGKIWNVNDEIYITGYACNEIDKKRYKEQQEIIERWNQEIKHLLEIYA